MGQRSHLGAVQYRRAALHAFEWREETRERRGNPHYKMADTKLALDHKYRTCPWKVWAQGRFELVFSSTVSTVRGGEVVTLRV